MVMLCWHWIGTRCVSKKWKRNGRTEFGNSNWYCWWGMDERHSPWWWYLFFFFFLFFFLLLFFHESFSALYWCDLSCCYSTDLPLPPTLVVRTDDTEDSSMFLHSPIQWYSLHNLFLHLGLSNHFQFNTS